MFDYQKWHVCYQWNFWYFDKFVGWKLEPLCLYGSRAGLLVRQPGKQDKFLLCQQFYCFNSKLLKIACGGIFELSSLEPG